MNENVVPLEVLERFSNQRDVVELSTIVTELIKSKKTLFKAIDDHRFSLGIQNLVEKANALQDAHSRLKAIATLGRLRAALRKKGDAIAKQIRTSLTEPLETSQFLESGEERYYIASGLQLAESDWIVDYCAREVVTEHASEKARDAFVKILLDRTTSIEETFEKLSTSWGKHANSEEATKGVVTRVKRIFQSLAKCLGNAKISDQGRLGEASRRFITSAFSGKKEPDDLKGLRELANAVALFLDSAIRARLSLLLDSSIYEPLKLCRRWFPLSSWPSLAARSKDFGKLGSTLNQAILITAKQGDLDKALLDALELCTGNRESALRASKYLVERNPGLSPEVQQQLLTWQLANNTEENPPNANDAFDADQFVAIALLEIWSLENLKPEERLGSMAKAITPLKSALNALASKRGITTFGNTQVEADYIPNLHALVGDLTGTRRVRILRPGVERESQAGIRHILIKAICESALASE